MDRDLPLPRAASAEGLLGQFVDLSLTQLGIRGRWKCKFCGDEGWLPPHVKHKYNCIVARAKDYLESV